MANEQRKIVFRFRNELLSADYDIDTKIDEIRQEYIVHLVNMAEIYDGMAVEDFDLEKVCALVEEELNTKVDVADIKDKEYEELVDMLQGAFKMMYDQKMAEIPAQLKQSVEKEIYLTTLDNAWREHLYQMDTMKTGIFLRGYNQKDPLVEYKKESFSLFNELTFTIKFETIKMLQIVQFDKEALKQREAFSEKKSQNENVQLSNTEVDTSAPKVKRNDPCPCGSGKKYKQCCGQSGPKKGSFAPTA